jgi:hypothetical protein
MNFFGFLRYCRLKPYRFVRFPINFDLYMLYINLLKSTLSFMTYNIFFKKSLQEKRRRYHADELICVLFGAIEVAHLS